MNQRPRPLVIGVLILFLTSSLIGQAILADNTTKTTDELVSRDKPRVGNTLISVQSYKTSGRLIEVTPDGEIVWKYAPANSNVFDAEVLTNGNILVAVATKRKPENCPEEQLQVDTQECVQNRVIELDYDTKTIVWNYTWYDEYLHNHEVHDVDRLANGNTAIIDMGNDRAFVVNSSGKITWEWQAERHLDKGTKFYRKYGGHPDPGGEKDWTHMNDIDRLANGNFQVSVRNFDVVIEINPKTHKITSVIGKPGRQDFLYEQHNPDRLTNAGTLLVADSENDRVVEINTTTRNIIWKYGGPGKLNWPRDADRLPNGNTLITDSFNNRVIEVNGSGEIVWQYRSTDLVYSADRIGVGENTQNAPSGQYLENQTSENIVIGTLQQYRAYTYYLVPLWMRGPELTNSVALVLAVLWFLVEKRKTGEGP